MKITSKSRYGLRLLLDVALHEEQGPVISSDVAQRQQIPLPYLKHLIAYLVSGGILRSVRGANGGLLLRKPPEEMNVREVIRLLEGPVSTVECVNDPSVCEQSPYCVARDLWTEVERAMEEVLETTTLRDLMNGQCDKERRARIAHHLDCGLGESSDESPQRPEAAVVGFLGGSRTCARGMAPLEKWQHAYQNRTA